jgi:hypothetical protein
LLTGLLQYESDLNEKKVSKRVLIIETGSILDEGIKSLLTYEPELDVSIVTDADPNALRKDSIVSHDIIVMSEASPLDGIRTSEFLRGIFPYKTSCVIIVRLEDNIVETYDKRCLKLTRNSDLITFIKEH